MILGSHFQEWMALEAPGEGEAGAGVGAGGEKGGDAPLFFDQLDLGDFDDAVTAGGPGCPERLTFSVIRVGGNLFVHGGLWWAVRAIPSCRLRAARPDIEKFA